MLIFNCLYNQNHIEIPDIWGIQKIVEQVSTECKLLPFIVAK